LNFFEDFDLKNLAQMNGDPYFFWCQSKELEAYYRFTPRKL